MAEGASPICRSCIQQYGGSLLRRLGIRRESALEWWLGGPAGFKRPRHMPVLSIRTVISSGSGVGVDTIGADRNCQLSATGCAAPPGSSGQFFGSATLGSPDPFLAPSEDVPPRTACALPHTPNPRVRARSTRQPVSG